MPFRILILLLFWATFTNQVYSQCTISGYVTDKANGETLIGTNIRIKQDGKFIAGALTNPFGFYSITVPEDNYQVIVSFIGYHSQEFTIKPEQKISLNVELSYKSTQLGEVTVTGKKADEEIKNAEMGVEKINVSDIKKLPVLLGEVDVIKTMQLLPGVSANGDGQSGVSVRGGSLDQNLILLDNAPVYNASHLLGFFSTFNSEAIKDVTLYKGTAPSKYGGRVSSVIDVQMNEGNNQNYNVSGGIGLISSKLNIEGPIQKGKSSFLVSGRRTYADVFLKATENFKETKLYFYDLNAKLNYRFSDKDRLYLSGYFGRDVLGLNGLFGLDWGNKTGTLRWNHLFGSKMFSNTSLIFSDYDYRINIENNINTASIGSRIQDWNFKQDFQYFPNNKHTFNFGYNAIFHTLKPVKEVIDEVTEVDNALETAFYLTHKLNLYKRFKLDYGLRVSNFLVLGNNEYYELDNAYNVIDTIFAEKPIDNYVFLEPRINIAYQLDEKQSIKASYTRNTQNLHLITNSVTTLPTDKWVMSSNNIKPQVSDQFSLGYFASIAKSKFKFSAEAYYKALQNQIDYKDNADEYHSVIETQLRYGIGRAYGLELLLKKTSGKLTGWIGYTLSRTERKIDGVNNDEWYLARQDKTHDISIVGMYDINQKWNVSAVWVYQTGNAVTFPTGKYVVSGQTVWLYSERNGYRVPAYHRFDLGATYKLKQRDRYRSELTFGVYNAYGRQNPYIITFSESKTVPGQTTATQTALFRWVPSISWNFKLK